VENGVGKLTAPEKGAPNVSMGKRDWRTPIPHLSLFDRKVGQGLIVFGDRGNIQRRLMRPLVFNSVLGVECSMLNVFQLIEKLLARVPYSAQLYAVLRKQFNCQ